MRKLMEQASIILNIELFKNSIQDYALALLTFCVLLFGLSLFKKAITVYLGKLAAKTASDADDFIVALVRQIGWPTLSVVSFYVATMSLTLPAQIHAFTRYAMITVVSIRSILLLQEIIRYSVRKVLFRRMDESNPSSIALVNSVVWGVKWGLWLIGAVFILDNLGVNISSLVAGIGIGGIAVAMASQAVLGDAFSALSIYLDKPFEIGDFIIIDDCMGTVEHVGVKTTRIRSLSGEQLVFSNSDLTKSRVKNYKRMQTRRIVFRVGVTYQTSSQKAEKIPGLIKDILRAAEVKMDRAHFQSFGDSALIYEIVYYVLNADYNVYMDKQQQINLAIMRKFEEEGIEFAYPTQTVYVKNGIS